MDKTLSKEIQLELSRNKRDKELGESSEDFIKHAILKVHIALQEDIRMTTASRDPQSEMVTTNFDNVMDTICQRFDGANSETIENAIANAADSQSTGKKAKAKSKKKNNTTSTAKMHLLQNPLAMRFLGLSFHIRKVLEPSGIYQSNLLTGKINGEVGGVSSPSFKRLIRMYLSFPVHIFLAMGKLRTDDTSRSYQVVPFME